MEFMLGALVFFIGVIVGAGIVSNSKKSNSDGS